jgi:putative membrane protein
MEQEPSLKSARNELILRDRLAADRTALANERTLLAYIRTALTLFAFGIAFTQVSLFDTLLFVITGWMFIPLAAVTLLIGLWRFQKCRKQISRLR